MAMAAWQPRDLATRWLALLPAYWRGALRLGRRRNGVSTFMAKLVTAWLVSEVVLASSRELLAEIPSIMAGFDQPPLEVGA
jgi:hypothetical protein